MQNTAEKLTGFQAHRSVEGGTIIQGAWETAAPFVDADAVRERLRAQVLERLQAKVPADLTEKRNRCRLLVAACRSDLNKAAVSRAEAVKDLERCWADVVDLQAIKAAEDAAAAADSRINSVSNRLRLAEGKLAEVSAELSAILKVEMDQISQEQAPIDAGHLKAEAAIQAAFDKHGAALAEAHAIKYFWWCATQRNDGQRRGFDDLAKNILAEFEHAPAPEPEAENLEPALA